MILYAAIAAVTGIFAYQITGYRENAGVSVMRTDRITRRKYQNSVYLTCIFLILFLFSAIRFGVGNDYRQYAMTAHEAYVGGYVVTEPGFNWLVRMVYTLFGGEYYEIVFAVFAFATLLFFLRAFYEQSESFAISYFLFMTFGMYFQTYNTVRYYLALSIAFYAMRHILTKNYANFIVWILAASFFHKSVLLTIPVYWIAAYAWKKWQLAAGLVLGIACFCLKGPLLKAALILYPSYENTIYLEGGTSLISILRCLAVLAFYLWYQWKYQDESRELRFYAQLNLLAVAVYVFFSFLPVVTRIGYYLSVSQLLLIPAVIVRIPEEKLRKSVKALVYAACIAYFILFLTQAGKEGVQLLPYRTWIFEAERLVY